MSIGPVNIRIADRERNLVQIEGFEIPQNKITFLFGESGIGKTLISKAIYGLLNPARLNISLNTQNYSDYLAKSGVNILQKNSFFVFQEPSSHLNPTLTIGEQLREGSLKDNPNETHILKQLWKNIDSAEIEAILNTFPKPYRPSGGEKQRILLAMAFKKIEMVKHDKTNFFVFDEPTGNLDNRYRNLVLERLYHYFRQKPFTLLFITHDYTIIRELYKHYQPFLAVTEFKELYRVTEGQSAMRTFSAEKFLEWQRNIHPLSTHKTGPQTVLTVQNKFSVFGKPLTIFGDARHQRAKDLNIFSGNLVYLKAPSGVGKTTLAKIIMGLIKPDKFNAMLGNLVLQINTPTSLWKKAVWGKLAGMVFQHADEGLNRRASVYQTFSALPLKKKLSRSELAVYLDPVFAEKVDITFLDKKIGQLSGGQKQRINILRTLLLNPKLVILDEPLNGLDFHSIQKILTLIETQRQKGTAFLIISHNEDIFDQLVQPENTYYLS